MLYSADRGVRRNTPAFGRLTPLSADGRSSSPYVEVGSAASKGLLREERVHQPLGIPVKLRKLRLGVALSNHQQIHLALRRAVLDQAPTRPASALAPRRLTNRDSGSISVVQIGANSLFGCRFCSMMRTGPGQGNRSDSWNVRCIVRASAVVTHSPNTEAKPRE